MNTCSKLKYDTQKHKAINNGLVKCTAEESCYYLVEYNHKGDHHSFSKSCTCSLNGGGRGYCDHALHDPGFSLRFERVLRMKKENVDARLHSLNRHEDFHSAGAETSECQSYYLDVKYKKASQCIYDNSRYEDCTSMSYSKTIETSMLVVSFLVILLLLL